MGDNLMDKVSALGERLKIGGSEVGRKMSEGMSSMSVKMRELFQGSSDTDKLVEDATSEALNEPDWDLNLELCDTINREKVNSVELIRSIKRRIAVKSPKVQYLAMVLLETCVKNCERAFSEVAAEKVLDEMVRLIDDPQTVENNRNKALTLIEAWGKSTSELRFLPVYEETYKSLKSRGIRFPGRDNESLAPIFTPPRSVTASEVHADQSGQVQHVVPAQIYTPEQTKEAFNVARNSIELLSTVLSSSPQQDILQDDLTATLVQQCRQAQFTVQRIVEAAGDDEALLFEALNVNDEIQKVLIKYEELIKPSAAAAPLRQEPAMIPVTIDPDEPALNNQEDTLIRKQASSRASGHGGNDNDDMMDDLDEMIFGKKDGDASPKPNTGQDPPKKQQSSKDDLISF